MPTAAINVPIWSDPPSISCAPANEDDHGRDDAEELDRREEDRRELLRVDVRDAVRLVQVAELPLERALAVERLHDRHPGDRLGELRRHGRDARAHVGERDVRRRLEPARDDDARRQHDERHDAEAPVEQEEAADRREQVSELTTSVVRPWLSTSESASTSLVRRAMIQPAFCCEK